MDDLQLVRNEFEAWNNRNLDDWLAHYSDKSVFDVPGGVHLEGLDGARMFWGGYQDGFPDNRVVERRLFGQDGQASSKRSSRAPTPAPSQPLTGR